MQIIKKHQHETTNITSISFRGFHRYYKHRGKSIEISLGNIHLWGWYKVARCIWTALVINSLLRWTIWWGKCTFSISESLKRINYHRTWFLLLKWQLTKITPIHHPNTNTYKVLVSWFHRVIFQYSTFYITSSNQQQLSVIKCIPSLHIVIVIVNPSADIKTQFSNNEIHCQPSIISH